MQEIQLADGKHVYTYGPQHEPVADVCCGEPVRVHTIDAFHNKLMSASDLPSEKTPGYPFVNPLTGPVRVKDAEPGDTLEVHLRAIHPAREFAVTALVQDFGLLTRTNVTPLMHDPLPERTRPLPIRDGRVWFDERRALPLQPFIGSLGVAPALEAVSSITPGPWGGNMDCVETGEGVTVLLPVFVPGALFFIGDAHARQGDGEVTGVAAEMPAEIELSFGLRKKEPIAWPRIQTDDYLMTVGSARPLEDATRIATSELVRWLETDHGFEAMEAYEFLGLALELRVGNVVDPNYSVVAKVRRDLL